MYAVPGIPYFVEVRVQESMRGLGLPIQTDVFFSQETGEALLSMNYIQYSCVLLCAPCDKWESGYLCSTII